MMRYAVISDVHGNLPALEAVLRDAEGQGAEGYIFLGDYGNCFPDADAVIAKIRGIKGAKMIRGNDDEHFYKLRGGDPAAWTDGQFCCCYWMLRNIAPENLDYVAELPDELCFFDSGILLRCFHKPHYLFAGTVLESGCYAYARDRHLFAGIADYWKWYFSEIRSDRKLRDVLSALPEGVYLFGHTHMQWHMELDGKLLLNPGSCGLSLDGLTTAAYTLLDWSESGWKVEERRVRYYLNETVRRLKSSTLYEEAGVWSELMINELTTGIENTIFFLNHAEQYAQSIGDPVRPFTKETWAAAYDCWPDKP